mmetsp:Transcript_44813/g.80551  ORF Transcript_44813/g.80551 Transcript_44813/m.80551 type:complete len:188 (-) Transcript_44813:82-645(-)
MLKLASELESVNAMGIVQSGCEALGVHEKPGIAQALGYADGAAFCQRLSEPGNPLHIGSCILVFGLMAYFYFFGGDGGSSSGGPSCSARHLLVKTEDECKKAKERIDGGEDFVGVAKEVSTCPSGKQGGSLGRFGKGQMVPQFEKVCFDPNTPIGKVMGPVQTQFGYHLIMVTERTGIGPTENKKES